MFSIDDSDEDPSSFWGKVQRGRVKPFAAQFYSPDYIEDYPWDSFDPSYANKLDLSFAALPPAEQFLRLPKGIVENKCNNLSLGAVWKMLTWLGDHGKAGDSEYTQKMWGIESRAWGIAKRFNGVLKRRREKLMKELGEEEVKRLRGVEKERKRERKKRKKEEDEEEKKRREKRAKVWEEYERKKKEEVGEDVRVHGRVVEDEGGVLRVEPFEPVDPPVSSDIEEIRKERERELKERQRKFSELLTSEGFEVVKARIVEFDSIRGRGNHKKAYLSDFMRDIGERVEGSIHKATGRLKAHFTFPRVADWTVEEAAVRGVIGMLEYVYLPVELKVATESGEEQLRVIEAPDEVRAYGAKKKLGDLLFRFLFETGIDKAELVRWVKSEKDLHRKLGMLLEKMTQAGMDRTRMQKVARPFGIKL